MSDPSAGDRSESEGSALVADVPSEVGTPSATPANLGAFLFALASVAGLAELAFILVNVSALPIFLKNGLGLPNLQGLALAAFYLAEALGNSPMGTLSDRIGRRRLMVAGALISTVTSLCTAFLRPPHSDPTGLLHLGVVAAVIGLRLLDGLGAAMLWPAVFATVGDRVPQAKQAQAMSALNITYLVGIAFGPTVGGYVNEHFGGMGGANDPSRYTPSFFAAAICFAITAGIAYVVGPTRSVRKAAANATAPEIAAAMTTAEPNTPHTTIGTDAHEGGHGGATLAALKKAVREVPALMLLGFLIFFGVGLIAPYAKTFLMEKFTLSESQFGTLLLWPALIIGAVSLPVGKLADMWGKPRAIHIGMAVCSAALWAIMTLEHALAVVLAGALLGVGFIMAFPAYMAYLADLTGPEERAGMIGAVRMAQGVGALLGAAFSSVLYGLDDKHLVIFIAASVLVTLGWGLSLFTIKRQPDVTVA